MASTAGNHRVQALALSGLVLAASVALAGCASDAAAPPTAEGTLAAATSPSPTATPTSSSGPLA